MRIPLASPRTCIVPDSSTTVGDHTVALLEALDAVPTLAIVPENNTRHSYEHLASYREGKLLARIVTPNYGGALQQKRKTSLLGTRILLVEQRLL
jgi:hypothetical protein